jgi:hypothetical protein
MVLFVQTARLESVAARSGFVLDVAKWLRLSAIISTGGRIRTS